MPRSSEFNPNDYKPVVIQGIPNPVKERLDLPQFGPDGKEISNVVEEYWTCPKCQKVNKKGDLSCLNPDCR